MENTTTLGLTSAIAAEKLIQVGPNTVITKRPFRPLLALLSKLNSPLLWIIIFASFVSLFVGERTNAIILLFMVSLSVTLDYVNTSRSEKAVQSLVAKVLTTVTVLRDGKEKEIPLADVVPDDVVALSAGNIIPADGWILDEKDLFVNQSTLTGESMPVAKTMAPAERGVLSTDNEAAVFFGTSVVSGNAHMLVVETGHRTSFGKIAEHLTAAEPPSDFERGIRRFSIFLMRVTIIMVVLVFILNALAHRGWLESFIFAVAIAVGLTPELLPVILTVSLSRGAVRMSRQKVIVKHLPAIQNIGRMNILCTDKTGTLTENKISVVKYVDASGTTNESVLRAAYITSAFHTGVNNPLDDAIRNYRTFELAGATKIDEIPFDFQRRRESIIYEEAGQRMLISKGAPEAIITICSAYENGTTKTPVTDAFRQTLVAQFTQLSSEGYRVLAVCARPITPDELPYEPDDEHNLTFLGFVALLDPPKAGVSDSLKELEQLGIEVKILTGDSLVLSEKICRDLALPIRGVITGDELKKLHTDQWPKVVAATTIFARIDPEQKEQIITHLQAGDNVVGFLGDGINDAPGLKAADVGVSVNNAVDVAKETADIILLQQDLGVLRDGVLEGRRTFHNTMKYIKMGLSSNFGNMFSMTVASAFLPFLPMLPTQILLNNFLYDTSQLMLSSDRVDNEDVQRPTGWNLHYVRKFMLVFGPVSSIFDFITFGVLLWAFKLPAASFQTGWFIESIATQIFVIYVIRTKRIPFIQSRPSALLLINTLLVVTVAWVIPYLPFGDAFKFGHLSGVMVASIAGIVITYLLLVEGVKHWFDRRWQESPSPVVVQS